MSRRYLFLICLLFQLNSCRERRTISITLDCKGETLRVYLHTSRIKIWKYFEIKILVINSTTRILIRSPTCEDVFIVLRTKSVVLSEVNAK